MSGVHARVDSPGSRTQAQVQERCVGIGDESVDIGREAGLR